MLSLPFPENHTSYNERRARIHKNRYSYVTYRKRHIVRIAKLAVVVCWRKTKKQYSSKSKISKIIFFIRVEIRLKIRFDPIFFCCLLILMYRFF